MTRKKDRFVKLNWPNSVGDKNVQSDWVEDNKYSDTYIRNKGAAGFSDTSGGTGILLENLVADQPIPDNTWFRIGYIDFDDVATGVSNASTLMDMELSVALPYNTSVPGSDVASVPLSIKAYATMSAVWDTSSHDISYNLYGSVKYDPGRGTPAINLDKIMKYTTSTPTAGIYRMSIYVKNIIPNSERFYCILRAPSQVSGGNNIAVKFDANDAETGPSGFLIKQVGEPSGGAYMEHYDNFSTGLVYGSDDGVDYGFYLNNIDREGDVARLDIGTDAVDLSGTDTSGVGSYGASGDRSFASNYKTIASGDNSHAEGSQSKSSGNAAHAEGDQTEAYGVSSHAEGVMTGAGGMASHVEGFMGSSTGMASHAEGMISQAIGPFSHAEGYTSLAGVSNGIIGVAVSPPGGDVAGDSYFIIKVASGDFAGQEGYVATYNGATWDFALPNFSDGTHAEGLSTQARGDGAHSEGAATVASGTTSHAEGNKTVAHGENSHAEGDESESHGLASHAEGQLTLSGMKYISVESDPTLISPAPVIDDVYRVELSGSGGGEGGFNGEDGSIAIYTGGDVSLAGSWLFMEDGVASHAEGYLTNARGVYSHAEGLNNHAVGPNSHAEGSYTLSGVNDDVIGLKTTPSGGESSGDAYYVISPATGDFAGQEGYVATYNGATWDFALPGLVTDTHAEGTLTQARSYYSHAEGNGSIASESSAHAEGYRTIASGSSAHSEGYETIASGARSHSEGVNTIASGNDSHAEGNTTIAGDTGSHSEGYRNIISINDTSIGMHVEGVENTLGIECEVFQGHYDASTNTPDLTSGGTPGHWYIVSKEGTQNISDDGSTLYEAGEVIYMVAVLGWLKAAIASGNGAHLEGNYANMSTETDWVSAIGIGTNSTNKKNGRIMWLDGTMSLPECTIAAIDARGNKSVATREYVVGTDSSGEGGGLVRGDEGNGIGFWRANDDRDNKDNVGLNGTDLSVSTAYIAGKGAPGLISYAEGQDAIASGDISHAEGLACESTGVYSHAEGCLCFSDGGSAHAQNRQTMAKGPYSHAEGYSSACMSYHGHVEGDHCLAGGNATYKGALFTPPVSPGTGDAYIVMPGATGAWVGEERNLATWSGVAWVFTTPDISNSYGVHAEGYYTQAYGVGAHAEGQNTKADQNGSHAEGVHTWAGGIGSHAEGFETQVSYAGTYGHAEGYQTIVGDKYAHAEGNDTLASGESSHAEGVGSKALGDNCHAEGKDTESSGDASHTEGRGTKTLFNYAHAEGYYSVAESQCSHAEGKYSAAQEEFSHVEGYTNIATKDGSHIEGYQNSLANNDEGHAIGTWDAGFNAPELGGGGVPAAGNSGKYYITTVSGTQTFGAGPIDFVPGDIVKSNGSDWIKLEAHPYGELGCHVEGYFADTSTLGDSGDKWVSVIGCGFTVSSKANGRVMWADGTMELPKSTNININSRGDNAVITRGYLGKSGELSVVINSASGTGTDSDIKWTKAGKVVTMHIPLTSITTATPETQWLDIVGDMTSELEPEDNYVRCNMRYSIPSGIVPATISIPPSGAGAMNIEIFDGTTYTNSIPTGTSGTSLVSISYIAKNF